MTEKQRRPAMFIVLAGVVAWSAWLALDEPTEETALVDVAEPAANVKAAHLKPVTPAAIDRAPALTPAAAQDTPSRLMLARANLFPDQTWYIPPPPPPPPPYVPPPPPQAPALPFNYMGKWQDAGLTTYYLMRGAVPVSVRTGQVLDGVWRLEPVSGGTLNFTYLPLNQTRSLRTGD